MLASSGTTFYDLIDDPADSPNDSEYIYNNTIHRVIDLEFPLSSLLLQQPRRVILRGKMLTGTGEVRLYSNNAKFFGSTTKLTIIYLTGTVADYYCGFNHYVSRPTGTYEDFDTDGVDKLSINPRSTTVEIYNVEVSLVKESVLDYAVPNSDGTNDDWSGSYADVDEWTEYDYTGDGTEMVPPGNGAGDEIQEFGMNWVDHSNMPVANDIVMFYWEGVTQNVTVELYESTTQIALFPISGDTSNRGKMASGIILSTPSDWANVFVRITYDGTASPSTALELFAIYGSFAETFYDLSIDYGTDGKLTASTERQGTVVDEVTAAAIDPYTKTNVQIEVKGTDGGSKTYVWVDGTQLGTEATGSIDDAYPLTNDQIVIEGFGGIIHKFGIEDSDY